MPAVPTNSQVQEMVKQAMLSQAPAMYHELNASGDLDRVAKERAELFDQTFFQITAEAQTKALRPEVPWLEKVQMLEEASRSATEQALAVALEFASDYTLTDDE